MDESVLRRRGRWPESSPSSATSAGSTLNVYWDTSGLVKLILVEDESELAEKLWDSANQVFTCRVAYPEARAALAAAWRDERLTTSDHVRAIDELDDLITQITLIEIGEPIARHAGDLADRFSLRGYDAVHLASALALTGDVKRPRSDPQAPMVAAWDVRLATACMKAGLAVMPPPPLPG